MLSCRSAWQWLSILLEFGKEVHNNMAHLACIDPYPIGVAPRFALRSERLLACSHQ